MNKLVLIAAATAALSTSAAFASTSAAAPTAACTKPVPVHVVNPTELPAEARNQTVVLVMTIDANGVPHDIRPQSYVDGRLARRLQVAVSQWRFKPEVVNGQATTTRVALPLTLGDETDVSFGNAIAQASQTHAN